MSMDGPIDPPEARDPYARACRACRDGRCEDCYGIGLTCGCCDRDGQDDRDEHDARDRGEGR